MSDTSATDSQNNSNSEDLIDFDSDVSNSNRDEVDSEDVVSNSGVGRNETEGVNVNVEVDSIHHIPPELARANFKSLRQLYSINIDDLEIYRVDSRFFDLLGDSTSTLICEGQLKAGMRLPFSKLVCDVLNFFEKTPIQMSSSFWTVMMIFEALNNLPDWSICLGDIVAYYHCVGGRSGDFVASLNKRHGMGT
ncbi:hypothetical protein FRX31_013017, partial [Thalictrum thalictroides]